MTYSLSPRLFVEDGPAIQAASAAVARSNARYWSELDADNRMQAIEQALKAPANDFIDDLPVAL